MADGGGSVQQLRIVERIGDIDAAVWDRCAGAENPFLSHAFLNALEVSGSATARTGWLPQHLIAEDGEGRVLGVVPMYLKSHSYGEYVFDHGWADAYRRAGGEYYPKLQCAVPFTPVTGPRLITRPEVREDASEVLL
ncbi:MAG: N-acetyltransferase, partial [Alphaproteobacteria bacterium]|nr:N-acetyltransferase [Alphaproteobacteria bacterium]